MFGARSAACAFFAAIMALAAFSAAAAPAQQNHVIEAVGAESGAAHFVINGNIYEIRGTCEGWREGDRVIFADGTTAASCGIVQLTNIDHGSTCRLECK